MTSPIEAKIVGRTLRYGKPYLLWTRVFAVSCIILPLVGKNASVPCWRVWKWGILPFYHMFSRFFDEVVDLGEIYVWPMFGESHMFILWTNVFWFTAKRSFIGRKSWCIPKDFPNLSRHPNTVGNVHVFIWPQTTRLHFCGLKKEFIWWPSMRDLYSKLSRYADSRYFFNSHPIC